MSPSGAGTLFTISSNTSCIFKPLLADTNGASLASRPIISSISAFISSGLALGRSILFITGNISKSWSNAKYTFANVCAYTPCAASTTNKAPSHAAKLIDTS